ncbi:MAG: hypothetical protein E6G59_08140 [Actinobacteria bacterium]|nr:MAG: hypothetical protein E6G59_08140 [Actinomycetota bacterium]
MIIGDDHQRLAAGLDLATAVMNWIDEASGAAAQAYLSEYERLASDRETSRRDFLDGVLGGELTTEEILARGEALGLEVAVPYGVAIAAFAQHGADETLLRNGQHRLRAMAAELPNADRSLVVTRGDEVVLIFPAEGEVDGMAAHLTSFIERAGGVIGAELSAGLGRPRESITELSGSYREAAIALAAARAGSSAPLAVYGEVLIEELILRERAVARRLARTILEPLDQHPDLLATLMSYMAHGPSLPAVAKRLYLHPNTVAYRLAVSPTRGRPNARGKPARTQREWSDRAIHGDVLRLLECKLPFLAMIGRCLYNLRISPPREATPCPVRGFRLSGARRSERARESLVRRRVEENEPHLVDVRRRIPDRANGDHSRGVERISVHAR